MVTSHTWTCGPVWLAFIALSGVGAAVAHGTLAFMTIGLPIVLGAAVSGVTLLMSRWARRGVLGLPVGVAVVLLYIAYLNRGGPGQTCTTSSDTSACLDTLSPWPWVAVGIAPLIASGVLQSRQQR